MAVVNLAKIHRESLLLLEVIPGFAGNRCVWAGKFCPFVAANAHEILRQEDPVELISEPIRENFQSQWQHSCPFCGFEQTVLASSTLGLESREPESETDWTFISCRQCQNLSLFKFKSQRIGTKPHLAPPDLQKKINPPAFLPTFLPTFLKTQKVPPLKNPPKKLPEGNPSVTRAVTRAVTLVKSKWRPAYLVSGAVIGTLIYALAAQTKKSMKSMDEIEAKQNSGSPNKGADWVADPQEIPHPPVRSVESLPPQEKIGFEGLVKEQMIQPWVELSTKVAVLRSGPGIHFLRVGTVSSPLSFQIKNWQQDWFEIETKSLHPPGLGQEKIQSFWIRNDLVKLARVVAGQGGLRTKDVSVPKDLTDPTSSASEGKE